MSFTRVAVLSAPVLAFGTLIVGCAAHSDSSGETSERLTVLGAASTRVINDDLVRVAGQDLTFINAGSSELVQQLHDGAPGDLLITADQKTMDRAVADGVATDPQVVATNSMVLVVPASNPARITTVADVQKPGVALVVCDVQVPCGAVTEKLAAANGLTLAPMSLEHSVTDTLGKVASGEADAGFVYGTDAAAAGEAVEVIAIPHAEEYRNALVAAVATGSHHPERAAALKQTLVGEEMATVWSSHGFDPADSAQPPHPPR